MRMRRRIWAAVAVAALAGGGAFWLSQRPQMVCVTLHGQCYHRPRCKNIRGRKAMRIPLAEAKKKFRPCKVCRPE